MFIRFVWLLLLISLLAWTPYVRNQPLLQYIVERGPYQTETDSDLTDFFGLLNAGQKCFETDIVAWCSRRQGTKSGIHNGEINCGCVCPYGNATYMKEGGCIPNKDMRTKYGGCGIFARNEYSTSSLKVLNLRDGPGRIRMQSGLTWPCSINSVSSYDDDHNRWQHIAITAVNEADIFTLTKQGRRYYFQWQQDYAELYNGKLLKVDTSCLSQPPTLQPCFLFKARGRIYYNVSVPTTSSLTLATQTSFTEAVQLHSTSNVIQPSSQPEILPTTLKMSPTPYHCTVKPSPSLQTGLASSSSSSSSRLQSSATMATPTSVLPAPVIPSIIDIGTSYSVSYASSPVIPTTLSSGPTSATKPQGKPDAQTSSAAGTIIGSVLATLLVLLLTIGLVLYCRRRKSRSSSTAKPSSKTPTGNNNPTYGRDLASDITLNAFPVRPPGNKDDGRNMSDSTEDEYDYATVDGPPRYSQPTPVYQGLADAQTDISVYQGLADTQTDDTPVYQGLTDDIPVYQGLTDAQTDIPVYQGLTDAQTDDTPVYQGLTDAQTDPRQQVYQSLHNASSPNTEHDAPAKAESVYNVLEEPHSEAHQPRGADTEPVYNTLEEPAHDAGLEYHGLTDPKQDHKYRPLEPETKLEPGPGLEKEPIYNVLEDSDMDYDNVPDEVPNRQGSQDNFGYDGADSVPQSPDYAKLEGPHSTAKGPPTKGPAQSPTYDVLERPYPPTAGNNEPRSHSIYEPLRAQAPVDDVYQPLDQMDQQPVYQALDRKGGDSSA